jgi:hypothetical protein
MAANQIRLERLYDGLNTSVIRVNNDVQFIIDGLHAHDLWVRKGDVWHHVATSQDRSKLESAAMTAAYRIK